MTVSAKKLRVAINGFGRIGRQFLRCWEGRTNSNLEVVCVNDSGGVKQASHLLKYDSTMGTFAADVKVRRATSSCRAGWAAAVAVGDPEWTWPGAADKAATRRALRQHLLQPSPLLLLRSRLSQSCNSGSLQVTGEDSFSINGKEIKVVSSRDPTKLPWGAMNIDLVGAARTLARCVVPALALCSWRSIGGWFKGARSSRSTALRHGALHLACPAHVPPLPGPRLTTAPAHVTARR